jgi:cytochrome c biogenesis protein CcdA
MSTDDRIRNKRIFKNPILLVGGVMTLFYLILGSLLLLNQQFLNYIEAPFRNIFAGMLIIYGLYRGWRIYADTMR